MLTSPPLRPDLETASPLVTKRTLPLGTIARIFRDMPGFLSAVTQKHGDAVLLQIGRKRIYIFNHPDLIEEVLVGQGRNFLKPPTMPQLQSIFGQGLLTSEGDLHRRQRRLMQPAFLKKRIETYGQTVTQCAAERGAAWQNDEVVDVTHEMGRLTLTIVGKTLLGVDFEDKNAELTAEELTAAVHHMMAALDWRMIPGAALWQKLPFPSLRRFAHSLEALELLVQRLISERHDKDDTGDLLSMLLLARDTEGDGGGMSDAQLRDEVMTIFLAGHETIANALNWSWYLLAQNPDAEARLHAEIHEVLAGRLPTAADLPNLSYTRAVLSEAMRLYPPGWAMARSAINDCQIGGHKVPQGATVVVSQWVMHRDARYFPEPLRFSPERWLGDAQAARPKFAYFPFGGGSRYCIGEGFAWLEGVLTLATLAQRWHLQLLEERVELQPVLTLRPRHGLKMKLRQRPLRPGD